ncbi:MAG: SRPBCC family protein [Microbacteriaceae bacterium]
MKLNHQFVVPVPFDTAWAAFEKFEDLVPCVPGASLTSVEGDNFTGAVKVKLGPISMVYSGTGVFTERDKATGRMVVEAKGKDKRGNGTAGATVTAQINAQGDSTAVEVTTDLSVTGKPAQFGRGVIQDVSDKLLGQFVDCVTAKLTAGSVDAAAGSADAAAAAAVDASESAPKQGTSGNGAAHGQGKASAGGPSAAVQDAADGALRDASAGTSAGAQAATPSSEASAPQALPRTAIPATDRGYQAKPAELNLLSTVMPVILRRYALPAVVALSVAVGIWIWAANRS